jgi:hypothetical protein
LHRSIQSLKPPLCQRLPQDSSHQCPPATSVSWAASEKFRTGRFGRKFENTFSIFKGGCNSYLVATQGIEPKAEAATLDPFPQHNIFDS